MGWNMTCQVSWVLLLSVGLGLAATPSDAQETQRWLHVHIEGTGRDDGNVALKLPLSAVGVVITMAPDEIISSDGCLVAAEKRGVSVSDIR